MLKRTAVITFIAFDLSVIATSAQAAPAPPQRPMATAEQSDLQLIAAQRQRVRRLTTMANPGGEPCGVWRCTWPTSNGGCLIWEKTKCKTINPFE